MGFLKITGIILGGYILFIILIPALIDRGIGEIFAWLAENTFFLYVLVILALCGLVVYIFLQWF